MLRDVKGAYFLRELSYNDTMTLSKRRVWLIVGLIVISLTGLVALQASLLNSAMDSKESAFRRNVLAAMGLVVQALEEQEAARVARELSRQVDKKRQSPEVAVVAVGTEHDLPGAGQLFPGSDRDDPLVRVKDYEMEYTLTSPQRVLIHLQDSTGLDTVMMDSVCDSGRHTIKLDSSLMACGTYLLHLETDSAMDYVSVGTAEPGLLPGVDDSGRFELVRKVVSNLVIGELRPIAERLESDGLDSLLSHYLTDAGVDLEYAFGVVSRADDSLALSEPTGYALELEGSDLKVQLFPNDVFADRADLAVFFPGRDSYLWFQMGPLLGATLLFVAIIIFCFIYSIRTITVQRRNARLMIDFVNNMTHEFKTPISTIALACEAILRPDVINSRERVGEFSRMIQSENKRMRNQTEKILQMAVLEEKDYELTRSEVNVHDVIKGVAETIALQVESRQGSITCELEAASPIITADRVHLEAIIHNLLDNANKYSPEKPSITVRTRNAAQGLIIEVEDRGVGLREEDQKRVFEKYFRVPSGDRHDVKGFGLGLSYVDLMMKAHGGRIALESSLGKGTLVRLIFPVGLGDRKGGGI